MVNPIQFIFEKESENVSKQAVGGALLSPPQHQQLTLLLAFHFRFPLSSSKYPDFASI